MAVNPTQSSIMPTKQQNYLKVEIRICKSGDVEISLKYIKMHPVKPNDNRKQYRTIINIQFSHVHHLYTVYEIILIILVIFLCMTSKFFSFAHIYRMSKF